MLKMKSHLISHKFTVISAAVILAFASNTVSAKKLYKWIDENGNAYYSDKIPPKANKSSHSLLNKSGRTIEFKGEAKTDEEYEKERETERLRKQQQLVIEQQKEKDKVLLKTFRSEDDLILARDGKIASIDNFITITKGNIKRFQSQLTAMQSQAANLEKSGKPIGAKFNEDIEQLKRQINNSYASIVAREQTKDEIRFTYNNDIERFRTLKHINSTTSIESKDDEKAKLNTVYQCPDQTTCNKAWLKAVEYVKKHSTTRLQLNGERLYMMRAPSEDTDISLTITRIKNKKTQQEKIFLDQQCRNSKAGEEFCSSKKIQDIKLNFIPALSN